MAMVLDATSKVVREIGAVSGEPPVSVDRVGVVNRLQQRAIGSIDGAAVVNKGNSDGGKITDLSSTAKKCHDGLSK
jgi:hypothetical protein